jgi:hypothetical protein|uniref:Link domain-containing protein n=1 Tax=viral metagenome TaxID=1070528 RepID=A0A6C0IQJ9_9ZZZZ
MENKSEQVSASAPPNPSASNNEPSVASSEAAPTVSSNAVQDTSIGNPNIKPKFNEATVSPIGFQELGTSLYGLDANPIGIFIVVTILILFFFTFDYLGVSYNDTNQTYGPLKESFSALSMFEILLWGLFIFLIMINGIQYTMGINIKTALSKIFSPKPEIDISVDGIKTKNVEPEEEVNPDEVFHIGGNKYNYKEANAICKAYNSELASYSQIEDSYNKGGEWCSYGWSKDQMALFPTQKVTWEKLQKTGKCGPNSHNNDCGRPGVNGGFIDNPMVRFGVNCYGAKPEQGEEDKKRQDDMQPYPKTKEEIELDKMSEKYKKKIKDMDLRPFNKLKWKEM